EGFEHQVEMTRLGQLAAALTGVLRGLLGTLRVAELVGPKALLALLAVDERVGEAGDVSGGFPDARVHQNGAVYADDVGARQHHLAPPCFLDVALELAADRTVVPATRQTAIDFARLERKPASFGEIYHLLHGNGPTHRLLEVPRRPRTGKPPVSTGANTAWQGRASASNPAPGR